MHTSVLFCFFLCFFLLVVVVGFFEDCYSILLDQQIKGEDKIYLLIITIILLLLPIIIGAKL